MYSITVWLIRTIYVHLMAFRLQMAHCVRKAEEPLVNCVEWDSFDFSCGERWSSGIPGKVLSSLPSFFNRSKASLEHDNTGVLSCDDSVLKLITHTKRRRIKIWTKLNWLSIIRIIIRHALACVGYVCANRDQPWSLIWFLVTKNELAG